MSAIEYDPDAKPPLHRNRWCNISFSSVRVREYAVMLGTTPLCREGRRLGVLGPEYDDLSGNNQRAYKEHMRVQHWAPFAPLPETYSIAALPPAAAAAAAVVEY